VKFIVFGDSFVNGLISLPKRNSEAERERINFAYKIYKNYKTFTEYENISKPGASNDQIAYWVYKYIRNFLSSDSRNFLDNYFFLIVWSAPVRANSYSWESDEYNEREIAEKNWYYETDMKILAVAHLCDQFKIKYAMINSFTQNQYDSPIFSYDNPYNVQWINGDKPFNTLFDIVTEKYCTSNTNYNDDDLRYVHHHHIVNAESSLVAPCGHPTDKGHDLIAYTLIPYIDNIL
jgi:hypothetical protein